MANNLKGECILMNKFSTGFVAGSVIGAIGLGYAMRNRRTRKRLTKGSKKFARKCAHMFENATDMF